MTLTFYCLSKKLGTIEHIINHELKFFVQWLPSNELSLMKLKLSLSYLNLFGSIYHVNQTLKLASANGILSKLCCFAPKNMCISIFLFILLSCPLWFLVWSHSTECNIDRIIKLQKCCVWIITYSEFTEHAGPLFPELKLLKVKDIFSLTKLLFIFDFINENIPEELKTIFVINRLYTHMKLTPQWHST